MATDLCKPVSYSNAAMTRMLDRLESKGLIQRARSTTDRRAVFVELTVAGPESLKHMREISRSVQNRSLRGFSGLEVRQLKQLLCRMLKNL